MARKRLIELGIKNVNDFMTMFMNIESKLVIKANNTVTNEDVVEEYISEFGKNFRRG